MILGDLGAEVIHVEPIDGDPTRELRGFGIGYFPYFSRNKKSLAVNIKSEEGRQIIFKLLAGTDVLIENFGPGTMDRLGYGYDSVKEAAPGLIYSSLKGFLSGPYEKRHALDEIVQMMGGLAYMTGPPGQPLRAGTSIVDISGALFGVISILLALGEREKTGKGQMVKSSLFETSAFLMGQHMAVAALSEDPVPPMPARVSAWSVYRTFPTQDGEPIFIGITSDRHWERFCRAFSREDLLKDPDLKTNNGRITQRDRLLPDLESMIHKLSREEVIRLCEKADIPFSPVARPEDLFEDPQLNQKLRLLETVFPGGIATKMPGLPLEMEGHEFQLRLDPPRIGEHTVEILQSVGYSSKTIQQLSDQEIVRLG
jgi:crotonobetainyl-CoA:carnitine CoA-transferase CaiB-like acyl-CoA transferase